MSTHPDDEHIDVPQRTHSAVHRQMTAAELEPKQVIDNSKVVKTDHPVTLAWKNVTYNVEIDNSDSHKANPEAEPKTKWRKLLNNMSGIARPGRTLAIMGPSGAGKTTLMSALTGRLAVNETQILDGRCEVNGVPLTNDLKRLVSVVAQDDIVMGKETPRDALTLSVRMRQGYDAERADKAVADVIDVLGLKDCADTQIGIPGVMAGISSSEKKRTNIGSELITEPYIMILDEPTTGLDSVNASRIGQILRDLAYSSGRTVICTIHTPSSELFNMFDDLLLLGKGHVVYHGPRADAVKYFAKIGHAVPARTNPTEHYMNILQLPIEQLQPVWEAWERNFVEDTTNPCINEFPSEAEGEKEILLSKCADKGTGFMMQMILLYKRALRMILRDQSATVGRLFQVFYLGIIVGLFFFGLDRDWRGVSNIVGCFFVLTMNTMMSAAMPAVVMFPAERAVYLMEQANAVYDPLPYAISKFVAEVPLNAIFPCILSVIVYWMINLRPGADHFFIFLLNLVMLATNGFCFGFACSTVFPRAELALAVIPLVALPLGIVGGLFANTERLDPDWMWLSYISFIRYSFIALADNEFNGRELCFEEKTKCLHQSGDAYIRQLGFQDWDWRQSMWLYVVETVVFFLIATFALWIQGYFKRGKMSFKSDGIESEDIARKAAKAGPKKTVAAVAIADGDTAEKEDTGVPVSTENNEPAFEKAE